MFAGAQGGDSAFGAEGGGIALSGDEFYNAACGGHVSIEYLFSPLSSYTLSRYAGLPLKGKRERYGIGCLCHMA